jgi:hypothetical protein
MPLKRNSGATLEPAMVKYGTNAEAQGAKMSAYPQVFAPVIGGLVNGYVMPMLGERSVGDHLVLRQAFSKLQALWLAGSVGDLGLSRCAHHTTAIVPLAADALQRPLVEWYYRARPYDGTAANVVHGDATLENIMVYNGAACWIDPSTRPMPLEVEFDVAKMLQTQFGYNGCASEPAVTEFVRSLNLRKEILGYYLMTHLVRLYKVQPQARLWAEQVARELDRRLEDVLCK